MPSLCNPSNKWSNHIQLWFRSVIFSFRPSGKYLKLWLKSKKHKKQEQKRVLTSVKRNTGRGCDDSLNSLLLLRCASSTRRGSCRKGTSPSIGFSAMKQSTRHIWQSSTKSKVWLTFFQSVVVWGGFCNAYRPSVIIAWHHLPLLLVLISLLSILPLKFGAGVVCDRGITLGDLIGVLNDFFGRLGNLLAQSWIRNCPLPLNF